MTNPDPNTDQLQRIKDATFELEEQAFTETEYRDRKNKLWQQMERRNLEVVLLSSPESQCWLHGYESRWYRTGSTTAWPPLNFTAAIRDDANKTVRVLLYDSEDHKSLIQLTSRIDIDRDFRAVQTPKLDEVHRFVLQEIAKLDMIVEGDKWGIEKWSPRQNAATTADLTSQLHDRGVVVEDVSVTMRTLQRIKSHEELTVMYEAAGILKAAYADLRKILQSSMNQQPPDITEKQVWAALETSMANMHGETAALHNTVALTRNYYHALSTNRKIGYGQLHADPSAVKHRYHVNAARQFWLVNPNEDDGGPRLQLRDASKIAADAVHEINNVAVKDMPFKELAEKLRAWYQDTPVKRKYWEMRDWIGGYQLGISFTPDWVGEFVWNVDDNDETDDYNNTFDPEDPASRTPKKIETNLVTNFESYVGGAGLIETIVFKEKGIEVLTASIPQTVEANEIGPIG